MHTAPGGHRVTRKGEHMTSAPQWVSPYTNDTAAFGYRRERVRPRSVTYEGRRFLVWPQVGGPGWCWRERGDATAYLASSEVLVYLSIGALCAIERKGGSFHSTREG